MKVKYEFVMRNIVGESFLVPIGEAALKYSGMFTLNTVGALVWEAIPTAKDEKELVSVVLEKCDVTEEQATKDIKEFIAGLREMGIVE